MPGTPTSYARRSTARSASRHPLGSVRPAGPTDARQPRAAPAAPAPGTGRRGVLAFEPAVGGRLTETYADGSVFVIGVIGVWEPPRRLVVSWCQASFSPEQSTELHVGFEPAGPGETRVSIEHYGWDALPAEHAARHGFPLPAFQLRFAEWWRALLANALLPSPNHATAKGPR